MTFDKFSKACKLMYDGDYAGLEILLNEEGITLYEDENKTRFRGLVDVMDDMGKLVE